jgi:hypothetical protein
LVRNITKAGALSLFLLVGVAQQPVHAYIDPGSASYAFQIVTGGILGGLFLVKTYWARLTSSVRDRLSKLRRSTVA